MKTAYRVTTVLAGLCLLSACGGGGSSGGSGGGGGGGSGSSQFSIGGSVSGLTAGSGVVLLDNGGNALTVPANASSFTFTSTLASGASYDVTIQSQPNGESCTVANGSGTASASVTSVSVTCASQFAAGGANVVALTVAAGPAASQYQTFNIPLVTVTVCEGATCAQIPNVLVDSGSEGLRIMASVLASAGLSVTPMPDPLVPGNTIHECEPFADGYSWGAVGTAIVKVGAEATAAAVPIQVIDDSATPNPAVPASGCAVGNSMNSVNAYDANGVLGVGVFAQDCGSSCTTSAGNDVYWSCTSGGSCTSTTLIATDEVENPVAAFAADNNGAIIQLPALSTSGASTASGYLVFGIGTESNNALGSTASVLTADSTTGAISTSFNGQMLDNGFIDSGSNALFFPDSTITVCSNAPSFYCPAGNPPSAPLSLSAVNQGQSGTTSNVAFQIVDLNSLSSTNFALDDVGGPAPNTATLSNYFDWGVPFFYGRTVYMALDGASAGGSTGPYYAY